jgi:hypothetical protein
MHSGTKLRMLGVLVIGAIGLMLIALPGAAAVGTGAMRSAPEGPR